MSGYEETKKPINVYIFISNSVINGKLIIGTAPQTREQPSVHFIDRNQPLLNERDLRRRIESEFDSWGDMA